MFSTKQTPPPSSPPTPEPTDILEVHVKLSGATLTQLIALALSIIGFGSAGVWGYIQAHPSSAPTDAPAISVDSSP